ncbi:hypothetical protein [Echinicola sp. 20G]|uniref:hypothetical protein n=1 Tax=Echinicola sp. 20G TaxID=2781961 RepID=UPI001910E9BE|nr:hypothetical protein [Echinicola sp. 20G]
MSDLQKVFEQMEKEHSISKIVDDSYFDLESEKYIFCDPSIESFEGDGFKITVLNDSNGKLVCQFASERKKETSFGILGNDMFGSAYLMVKICLLNGMHEEHSKVKEILAWQEKLFRKISNGKDS